MASHYTQWCERFILSSKEEADWLRKVLAFDLADYELNDDLSDSRRAVKVLNEEFGIKVAEANAEFFPGFSSEFDGENEAYFYSKESGNLDNAVAVIQAFMKKFRPNGYFKIEWADSCSKPRAGEFGGGAVFVTANDAQWMHTCGWVSKHERDFLDAQWAKKKSKE